MVQVQNVFRNGDQYIGSTAIQICVFTAFSLDGNLMQVLL